MRDMQPQHDNKELELPVTQKSRRIEVSAEDVAQLVKSIGNKAKGVDNMAAATLKQGCIAPEVQHKLAHLLTSWLNGNRTLPRYFKEARVVVLSKEKTGN